MPMEMWKTVETETRKTGVVKRERRDEMRRKNQKREIYVFGKKTSERIPVRKI